MRPRVEDFTVFEELRSSHLSCQMTFGILGPGSQDPHHPQREQGWRKGGEYFPKKVFYKTDFHSGVRRKTKESNGSLLAHQVVQHHPDKDAEHGGGGREHPQEDIPGNSTDFERHVCPVEVEPANSAEGLCVRRNCWLVLFYPGHNYTLSLFQYIIAVPFGSAVL